MEHRYTAIHPISTSRLVEIIMKKLLRRLLGQTITPPDLAALPVSPETILAVEPLPMTASAIDVDTLFYPWLLGTGEAEVQELNEAERSALRALKRMADSEDPGIAELVPRMPSVIPMLLRSLRERDVSNVRLAEQITRDAVLVAAVLKQVNSSYFRRSSSITSIEQALTVIGQNGLRILVASVAFKPLFNLRLGYFTNLGAPRMWDLSSQYGIACRHFATRRGMDGFEAFLAGLLQNVGVVVALRIMDQVPLPKHGELRSLAFFASFAHYARRLARVVGRQWEFPENVIAAVRDDSAAASPIAVHASLAEVLRLADKTTKIRLLVRQGRLQEEDVDACLDGEDIAACLACYRELAAMEDDESA